MMRSVRMLAVVVAVVASMLGAVAPASAQEGEGGQWYWRPDLPNHMYCAYYPGTSLTDYWCYWAEAGQWTRAVPGVLERDGWLPA
jgi:hypothetical protein